VALNGLEVYNLWEGVIMLKINDRVEIKNFALDGYIEEIKKGKACIVNGFGDYLGTFYLSDLKKVNYE